MQIATCQKCGAQTPVTETFCSACGTVLAERLEIPPAPAHALSSDVCFPLTGNIAEWVQRNVPPEETILFSLENEEHLLALVGLHERLLVVRRNQFDTEWVKATAESIPYDSIAEVRHGSGGVVTAIQLHVYTFMGRPDGRPQVVPFQVKIETFMMFNPERAAKVAEVLRELVAEARTKKSMGQ